MEISGNFDLNELQSLDPLRFHFVVEVGNEEGLSNHWEHCPHGQLLGSRGSSAAPATAEREEVDQRETVRTKDGLRVQSSSVARSSSSNVYDCNVGSFYLFIVKHRVIQQSKIKL